MLLLIAVAIGPVPLLGCEDCRPSSSSVSDRSPEEEPPPVDNEAPVLDPPGADTAVGLSALADVADDARDTWAIAFSPDGATLAAGGADGTIRLYQTKDGSKTGELAGHLHIVRALAFTPDGAELVSGSCDDSVFMWDLAGGRPAHAFTGRYFSWMGEPRQPPSADVHRGCVSSVAVSSDGKFLASGSNDRTARIWDLKRRAAIGRINNDALVSSVDFSPDTNLLAFSDFTPKVVLWNRLEPEAALRDLVLPSFRGPPEDTGFGTGMEGGSYKSVAIFVSDGELISGGGDGALRLWSVAEGGEVATLESTFGPVFALSLHPSGRYVASGHQSGTVALWDLQARRLVGSLQRQPNITSLAFSSDGARLASASHETSGIQLARVTLDGRTE